MEVEMTVVRGAWSVGSVLVNLFAVTCASACVENHGWGSLEARAANACRDDLRAAKQVLGSEVPESDNGSLPFHVLTDKPEAEFVADCAHALAQSLGPCTEFKPGSDSALLCTGRRWPQAWKGYLFLRCLQAAGVAVGDDATQPQIIAELEKVPKPSSALFAGVPRGSRVDPKEEAANRQWQRVSSCTVFVQ
jgi:hypothetical protein